jgi:hypothetical protein
MLAVVVSFLSLCPQKPNTLIVKNLKILMRNCCVACNVFYAVEMLTAENSTLAARDEVHIEIPDSHQTGQEIPLILWHRKFPLLCSREPAAGTYPKPH